MGNLIQCMMSHKNFSYIQMVPIFQSAPFASCPYVRCHWKDSHFFTPFPLTQSPIMYLYTLQSSLSTLFSKLKTPSSQPLHLLYVDGYMYLESYRHSKAFTTEDAESRCIYGSFCVSFDYTVKDIIQPDKQCLSSSD